MPDPASTSSPSSSQNNGGAAPALKAGLRLGFLGFGKMGQALARGLRGRYSSAELTLSAFDAAGVSGETAGDVDGLQLAGSAAGLEESSDVLILAVKPGDMQQAVASLNGRRKYISIAAGLSTERLQSFFPHDQKGQNPQISRVMPNISALAGHGASGIFCEDDEFFSLSEAIFSAIGSVVRVKSEDLMHAVTGLSGSGPAYVLAMVHALAEGGVQAGLPFATALDLARETVLGTAELLRKTGEHPATLRNQVTSPGGTTIAGLAVLEDGGFHGTVMGAVVAAADRSRELE